ncbi:MAG: hypothetical protein HC807_02005, partial [Gammaproteobacteria bacterium]|nr:hypothetical protein [Gammaproteobacteria bacterium]
MRQVPTNPGGVAVSAPMGDALATPLAMRDRAAIVIALVAVSLVAWIYLWHLARSMAAPDASISGAMEMATASWSGTTFLLMFVMWWVMMIGMMLPGAMPMILTFATVNGRRRARGHPFVGSATLLRDDLVAWGGFGLAATV